MHTEEFIKYISFEKRYSPHTIKAYEEDLKQFFLYIGDKYGNLNISDIDYLMIRSWLVELMNNSLNTRSVNRKISTLKSFYKFLLKEGLLQENPMNKIVSPKTAKRTPVFIEKDKIDMLLDEVDFGNGFPAVRDKLIVEMFYSTGIRLSELINIRHKDIDVYSNTLKVLGKRNKQRILPFTKHLKALISDYTKAKEEMFSDKGPDNFNEHFFVTEKGEKVYPELVYRIVHSCLEKVSTVKKKSPHVLRHTFATHMLNNGADLNAIKELLGHANLSATQIYTHNTFEKLKNIYKQAHPRA